MKGAAANMSMEPTNGKENPWSGKQQRWIFTWVERRPMMKKVCSAGTWNSFYSAILWWTWKKKGIKKHCQKSNEIQLNKTQWKTIIYFIQKLKFITKEKCICFTAVIGDKRSDKSTKISSCVTPWLLIISCVEWFPYSKTFDQQTKMSGRANKYRHPATVEVVYAELWSRKTCRSYVLDLISLFFFLSRPEVFISSRICSFRLLHSGHYNAINIHDVCVFVYHSTDKAK